MAEPAGRRPDRWAPWWVYLIAIVGTNAIRTQLLQPDDLPTWLEIVIGLSAMTVVVILVTAVHRAMSR